MYDSEQMTHALRKMQKACAEVSTAFGEAVSTMNPHNNIMETGEKLERAGIALTEFALAHNAYYAMAIENREEELGGGDHASHGAL